MNNIKVTCQCGQQYDGTACNTDYGLLRRNKEGEIVFATCRHGVVIVDKASEIDEEFLKTKRLDSLTKLTKQAQDLDMGY